MIAENEGDDDDDRILRGLGKEWNGASLPVVPWGNKVFFPSFPFLPSSQGWNWLTGHPKIAPIFLFVCLKLNEKVEAELGFGLWDCGSAVCVCLVAPLFWFPLGGDSGVVRNFYHNVSTHLNVVNVDARNVLSGGLSGATHLASERFATNNFPLAGRNKWQRPNCSGLKSYGTSTLKWKSNFRL